jgi:hypothetical protein
LFCLFIPQTPSALHSHQQSFVLIFADIPLLITPAALREPTPKSIPLKKQLVSKTDPRTSEIGYLVLDYTNLLMK